MQERSYNYCPYCGIKILRSKGCQVNYCRNCGKKLNKGEVNIVSRVQCPICRQYVWQGRLDTIECSFCGSKYHSKCVTNWLTRYNSCPLCQNVYLKPRENIIKIQQ